MKTKYSMLAAAIVLSQSAFAQTSSTTTAVAPDATATNASVATSAAPAAEQEGIKPMIKYVGILRGPGADFANSAQKGGENDDQSRIDADSRDQLDYEQRVKFLASFSKNVEAGIEARINANFGKGEKTNFTSGSWRLMANFKNVYKDDVLALTLTPRAFLPTSNSQRNKKTTVSPDLIADLAIAPKNTKFSFDTGLEYIHLFHTDGANASDSAAALTSEFAPWIEADYQLTDKTQLMVSYWPVLDAYARQGRPLATSSNEIDVGAYYEFAKGWQVNPYVAIEPNGMKADARLENVQLLVIVAGAIL